MQDMIEGKLEKRAKGVFAPAGGRRLVAFIDDLNMPKKSKFGFIPPLELLKLWADNGFWWGCLCLCARVPARHTHSVCVCVCVWVGVLRLLAPAACAGSRMLLHAPTARAHHHARAGMTVCAAR
jgi:hypothetical protein